MLPVPNPGSSLRRCITGQFNQKKKRNQSPISQAKPSLRPKPIINLQGGWVGRKNLLQGFTKNILSIAAIERGPAITQINKLPYWFILLGALILIMMFTLRVKRWISKPCSGRIRHCRVSQYVTDVTVVILDLYPLRFLDSQLRWLSQNERRVDLQVRVDNNF